MRRLLLVVSLAFFPSLFACGPGFDENTGGDGSRGEAREVATDRAIDDRVSTDQGDNTDWKKFSLDSDSKVTVRFWWDEPAVKVNVTLRDELGVKLVSLNHARGQREEILGPVKLKEGAYFLEVATSDGESVYTFEIQTGGGGVPTPDF